jgi:uroporphyrinogen-III synthase
MLNKISFLRSKEDNSRASLKRLISALTATGLTYALYDHVQNANMTWDIFIAYSISMAIATSPELAIKLLTIWKSDGKGNPNDTVAQ